MNARWIRYVAALTVLERKLENSEITQAEFDQAHDELRLHYPNRKVLA